MFSTSLATAALAGLLASGSLATPPAWQTDYQKARTLAAENQKPLAVFITRGEPIRLLSDGGFGAETALLLRQNYVCLTVDTATASGQELATSFKISEGIVISDRSGGVQALRHEGTLTRAELSQHVTRYAGIRSVNQTIYTGRAQPYGEHAYQNRPILNAISNVRQFFGGG